jgi:hypothetical protein
MYHHSQLSLQSQRSRATSAGVPMVTRGVVRTATWLALATARRHRRCTGACTPGTTAPTTWRTGSFAIQAAARRRGRLHLGQAGPHLEGRPSRNLPAQPRRRQRRCHRGHLGGLSASSTRNWPGGLGRRASSHVAEPRRPETWSLSGPGLQEESGAGGGHRAVASDLSTPPRSWRYCEPSCRAAVSPTSTLLPREPTTVPVRRPSALAAGSQPGSVRDGTAERAGAAASASRR